MRDSSDEESVGQGLRRVHGAPTRRRFLAGSGALTGVAMTGLTGCETFSLNPEDEGDNANGGSKGKQAPMLERLVESGDLPDVEDRLPDEPVEVTPAERPGDYGGEWRSVLFGSTEEAWLTRTMGYEHLVRWQWDPDNPDDLPEAVPNIAESIESNDEGTEFTFHLRPGMKWSDGEPFTADDLVFAQNDVLNNAEIFPVPPWPATAEKIDGYTVRLTFTEPDGLFLAGQAGPNGWYLVTRPMHYLRQFHAEYNEDIDELVEQEELDNWVDLFNQKGDAWQFQNPELPTLRAWIPQGAYGDEGRMAFERNPYYWKVDPDGSQLPYIDRAVFEILNETEVAVTQASSGEIDFIERTINTLTNKPVLARSREGGDYRFLNRVDTLANFTVISLNLTHEDPVKREIFNEKDFRIGLSHAINRNEIIDTVFQQQGEPWQPAPRRESPFFDEELAKQYTSYDVDLANEHLDRVYPDTAGDGVRLGPDGSKIVFTLEFVSDFAPEWVGTLELVTQYWREVGVQVNLRPMDRSLYHQRRDANQHDANVWEGAGGWRDDILLDARWFLPVSYDSNFATPWGLWFSSDGADGAEPPEDVRQQMELYRSRLETTDPDEQDEIMREVLTIARDQFYCIGINIVPDSYAIATNRFRNVPERIQASWIYQPPGSAHPEQFFIESDQQ